MDTRTSWAQRSRSTILLVLCVALAVALGAQLIADHRGRPAAPLIPQELTDGVRVLGCGSAQLAVVGRTTAAWARTEVGGAIVDVPLPQREAESIVLVEMDVTVPRAAGFTLATRDSGVRLVFSPDLFGQPTSALSRFGDRAVTFRGCGFAFARYHGGIVADHATCATVDAFDHGQPVKKLQVGLGVSC